MICKICGSITKSIFSAKIIKKYQVDYFNCEYCGFLQTEEPYWLEEAYNEVINISDTGILKRNLDLMKAVSILIYFLFNKDAQFLDFAGGYGTFTRLMRDIGFDYYYYDKYSKNLFARGFEYDVRKMGGARIECVTAFECFEHFQSPMEEIKKISNISKNIIFSTTLLPDPIPNPSNWWYYGLNHGQHISFYSRRTLQHIANVLGLSLYSDGTKLHLMTNKKINTLFFKFLLKINRTCTYYLVQNKMKSKTSEDMNYLISGLNGHYRL